MNLLLTGAFTYAVEQIDKLESLNLSVFFMQQEKDGLPIETSQIDAVVCNGLFLYHDIDEFEHLKFIQLTSAGLDRVPVARIRERGIQLYNARGVYSIPMAEWVVFRVLEYYKRGTHFYRSQQEKAWNKERMLKELNGCTVGVVGLGNVGQEVAKRFKAFGTKIVAVDLFPIQNEYVDFFYAFEDVEQALPLCDVVVLTLPLTDKTFHWLNRERLEQMNPEAILVNIARGAVIHEADLIEFLRQKKIAYAALDVFEEEPLSAHSPLWKMENVAVSPHNSFVSNRNNERMFDVIYQNLKLFVAK